MTHFSSRIGRIYFADLVGAGIGCLGIVLTMQVLPAPYAALVVALLAWATALVLCIGVHPRRIGGVIVGGVVVALLVGAGSTTDLFRMRYVKSWQVFYSETEVWNAFSRVAAFRHTQNTIQTVAMPHPNQFYSGGDYAKVNILDIDGAAWTPMFHFNGDIDTVRFLRESVLYVAHHVRRGNVLIIGTGGGRDLLAAKAFDQPSVLGLEINPSMREIVQNRYGEVSGRPYSLPGVNVIIDEARSRIATLDEKFDVIQLSLIDTFSLNAAGGFVFSENYLYTKEAFQEYFRHLTDDGILSITRFFSAAYPLETLKLVGMARAAWGAEGIESVDGHIVVLSQSDSATTLVKRTPFTAAELDTIDKVAAQYNMSVLHRPGVINYLDSGIGGLIRAPDFEAYLDAAPFLIGPPTDDRPFFFNFLRGRLAAGDIPGPDADPFQFLRQWHEALSMLYLLVGVVTVLAAVFFLGPLVVLAMRSEAAVRPSTAVPLLLYFACLGYGFMMLEVPLLQRFVLFLGYPVYALAVVLFALLLFSGAGSLLSSRFSSDARQALIRVLVAIMLLAIVYLFLVPVVIDAFLATSIYVRIFVTVAFLAPIGLVLGMAYPLGITVLRGFSDTLVPWAWGLNGALSVVASVLAIVIGSRFGFSVAFLTGIAAYGVALVVMATTPRLVRASPEHEGSRPG
jgi:spermidine synthase